MGSWDRPTKISLSFPHTECLLYRVSSDPTPTDPARHVRVGMEGLFISEESFLLVHSPPLFPFHTKKGDEKENCLTQSLQNGNHFRYCYYGGKITYELYIVCNMNSKIDVI